MADRVKYFLLGVLFLVVAGVIAYDKWNAAGPPPEVAKVDDTEGDFEITVPPRAELSVEPNTSTPGASPADGAGPPSPPAEATAPTAHVTAEHAAAPEPAVPGRTPEAGPRATATRTHVIRKGETLEAIAIHYYGTREGVPWIVEANRLDNPHRIYVNQRLVIPTGKETAREHDTGKVATPKRAGAVPPRYVVKEGDGDLYAICRRFYGREGQGARVARVMEINHLYSADVKAGTILILPPP